MSRQGFDLMTVDLQHGLIDYQMALTTLQVLQGLPAPVQARVPWNEPGILMKCLDPGFSGAICPTVNTETDARQLVAATRYAPLGQPLFRSDPRQYGIWQRLFKSRQFKVLVLAMIETREALANLDSILSVEGIDGVYAGPSDLGLSLGYEPTLEPTAPGVLQSITAILTRAKSADKIAGVHTGSPAMLARMLAQGFDFASLLTDVRLFTSAVTAQLAAVRDKTAEAAKGY